MSDSVFKDLDIKNPRSVFEHAIKKGFLVEEKNHERSVYDYMYMHSKDGKDYFKNSLTRQYIVHEDGYNENN